MPKTSPLKQQQNSAHVKAARELVGMVDNIWTGGCYHEDRGYCDDDSHKGGENEVIREQCKEALVVRQMSMASSLFEDINANQIIPDDSEQPVIESHQTEGMDTIWSQCT